MGLAVETVVGYLDAAAVTTRQVFTPSGAQSFTVRAASATSKAHLRSVWSDLSGTGQLDIRSPRLHDAIEAVNLRAPATDQRPLVAPWFDQPLIPVDVLDVGVTFDAAPVAATVEGVAMLIQYDDLPGATLNARNWSEVQPVIKSIYGVEVTPATGATAGTWGPGVAINSTQDQFKANELYAVLGYLVSGGCIAVGIQGADTSNYLVGGPGSTDALVTRSYFVDLANASGLPLIPVIQANNKQSTLVTVAGLVAATNVSVSLILANLAS